LNLLQGLIENAAYLVRPDGYISVIDSTANGEQMKQMLHSFQITERRSGLRVKVA
jgi:tRNA1(Val) A37 N6-methylase TrmN6